MQHARDPCLRKVITNVGPVAFLIGITFFMKQVFVFQLSHASGALTEKLDTLASFT